MEDLEAKVSKIATYICNKLGGRIDFVSTLEKDAIDLKWRKIGDDGIVISEFKWKLTYKELEYMFDLVGYAQSLIDRYAETESLIDKYADPEKKVNLPRSFPEKERSFKEEHYLEHWMYVWELKELLEHLKPDDWLTPNQVNNLLVSRGDDNTFAAIDFYWNLIDFFGKQEDIGLKGDSNGG